MAQIFLKAAGGNWSAAGTWSATGSGGGDSVGPPNTGDDVVLQSGSGNLTIDTSTNVIRSYVATGYAGTVTHSAGVTLNIGGASAPTSNIAVVFAGTYTISNATTSAISIADTSAATNTYNFNGATLGNVTINNGTTTTTQLVTNGFTTGATATVTVSQGKFDTNGQTCTWGLFSYSNSNTKTISFGSSSITIIGAGAAWNGSTTGTTVSSNTATVTLQTANNVFRTGGTFNFNGLSVVFSGGSACGFDSNPGSTYTFANVTFTGTASLSNVFQVTPNITCTGTITINGNSIINRVRTEPTATSSSVVSRSTLSASSLSLSNVNFRNCIGAGSVSWNISGIPGGSGDYGGNSGIIFTTSQTQTWQGSVGANWSNLASWSSRVPLPQDDVIINEEFQLGQTITCNVTALGRNINFTGVSGNPTLNVSSTAIVTGSLTLASGMTVSGGASSIFLMGQSNYTINTAGVTLPVPIVIDNISITNASYSLSSNFSSTSSLTFNTGVFNANGFNVSASSFSTGIVSLNGITVGSNRIINMGSGVWSNSTTSATQTIWNATNINNLTFNFQTSTLNINNPTSSNYTFIGGGLTYNNVNFSLINGGEGNFTISGNNTFNQLTFNSPNTVLFTNGSTQTCTFFTANGATSGAIVMRSTVNNFAWNLNVRAGYSVSNVDLRDSNASGSAILP